MQFLFSVLVKNRFGAMMRVSNVFSRRGINIRKIVVEETYDPEISVISLMVTGDDMDTVQLDKQLQKIEDVVDCSVVPVESELSEYETEMLCVKILRKKVNQEEIEKFFFDRMVKILYVDEENITARMVGSSDEIDKFIKDICDFKILEMFRSRVSALDYINKTFTNNN